MWLLALRKFILREYSRSRYRQRQDGWLLVRHRQQRGALTRCPATAPNWAIIEARAVKTVAFEARTMTGYRAFGPTHVDGTEAGSLSGDSLCRARLPEDQSPCKDVECSGDGVLRKVRIQCRGTCHHWNAALHVRTTRN